MGKAFKTVEILRRPFSSSFAVRLDVLPQDGIDAALVTLACPLEERQNIGVETQRDLQRLLRRFHPPAVL